MHSYLSSVKIGERMSMRGSEPVKQPITFIHSADLHLDSPFHGLSYLPTPLYNQMKDSTFQAYERLIEHAVENKVDFVLLVGDLFDENSRSIKSQIRLRKGFEILKAHEIEVFITYGNHDHLGGKFQEVTYPENVHIFNSENVLSIPFYKNKEHVATIHGFSYESRSILDSKAEQFQVHENETGYQIAMLHGSVATNTDHDTYAPFRVSELTSKRFDYWALGHIHKREILHDKLPYVVYPGNTQGRHHKEQGEKGCYLVKLDSIETKLKLLSTSVIRLEKKEVDISKCKTINDVVNMVTKLKDIWRKEFKQTFIQLKLNNDGTNDQLFLDQGVIDEVSQILNEDEESEVNWVWLQEAILHQKTTYDRSELKKGSHFLAELINVSDSVNDISALLEPFHNHHQVRRYLSAFSEGEQEKILSDAEQLVLQSLIEK